MPRVNTTKKNRAGKAIKCGKCGAKIKPGESYKHWKFRYGGKHIRCMKADCAPRASDLTQGRIGDVYRIEEAVQDAVDTFRKDLDFDSFSSEIESQISEAENLADEFQSSLDNMPEGLQQGDTGQLIESRIDALNEYKDALQSALDSADWPDSDTGMCSLCGEPEEDARHDSDGEEFKHEYEPEGEDMSEAVETIASEFEGISYSGD